MLPLPWGQGEYRGPRGCAPVFLMQPSGTQTFRLPPGYLEGQVVCGKAAWLCPCLQVRPELGLWSLYNIVGPATREVLTPTLSLLASMLSGGEYLFTSFGGYSRGTLLEGHLQCSRLQKAGIGEPDRDA